MIDTDEYEGTDHPELVKFEGETLGDTLTNLIIEVKRLSEIIGNREWTIKLCDEEIKRWREDSKKKGDVLTTLDEMIRNYASHVKMMKALERGLDLPETWKEMIE